MKLIAGLGNPGAEYARTRHNAGFRVLDRLAAHLGETFRTRKFKGVCAQAALPAECQGRVITTVEGMAERGRLHPLQQAFAELGAAQCCYCTPGMLLTAQALLAGTPEPTRDEIREALAGNLCRCTGYSKILDAVELAALRLRGAAA